MSAHDITTAGVFAPLPDELPWFDLDALRPENHGEYCLDDDAEFVTYWGIQESFGIPADAILWLVDLGVLPRPKALPFREHYDGAPEDWFLPVWRWDDVEACEHGIRALGRSPS